MIQKIGNERRGKNLRNDAFTQWGAGAWAILPESFSLMRKFVDLNPNLRNSSPERIWAACMGAGPNPPPRVSDGGGVGIICLFGAIGRSVLNQVTSFFRFALNDRNISSIIFQIDSPGGALDGIPELADEIFAARGRKKIIAIANTMAASAAYWIASSADEVVVTPSGSVGSIGVFAVHEDLSKALDMAGVKVSLVSAGKYKVEGNPYEPLSDGARTNTQYQVNSFHQMFVQAVARGRNVSSLDVRRKFGEGRIVLAASAVRAGMADRVATLDQTLARIGAGNGKSARAVASRSLATLRRELALNG
jgi:signal peptide peptidase SppA